jgi:hypothetical protein
MKSYISRKLPLATRMTARNLELRSLGLMFARNFSLSDRENDMRADSVIAPTVAAISGCRALRHYALQTEKIHCCPVENRPANNGVKSWRNAENLLPALPRRQLLPATF